MQTVTPRQMQVLKFIFDYRAAHGYSPTMQEIGDNFALSKVTVFEHVGALEKKSLLRREGRHKARSLQVSETVEFPAPPAPTRIPLAGVIAAGHPIEAVQGSEVVDLQELFPVKGETFCLRVRGNSMIDDQIRDGDLVVCQQTNSATNGQTVVALLDTGEATLKRFYRERGKFRLQPANPEFEPIYVENVNIQGVVVGVIRRL